MAADRIEDLRERIAGLPEEIRSYTRAAAFNDEGYATDVLAEKTAEILGAMLALLEQLAKATPSVAAKRESQSPTLQADGTLPWNGEEAHREQLVADFWGVAADRRRQFDAAEAALRSQGAEDEEVRSKLGAPPPPVGPVSNRPAESLVRLMEAGDERADRSASDEESCEVLCAFDSDEESRENLRALEEDRRAGRFADGEP